MPACARREHGIALITALLIVAIIGVIAVQMVDQQRLTIHRSANVLRADAALQAATGVEAWAIGQLLSDENGDQTDHLQENWAKPLPETKIEIGTIRGHIEDLQARANINPWQQQASAGGEDDHERFFFDNENNVGGTGTDAGDAADTFKKKTVLISTLESLSIAPELASAIQDWADTDADARHPGGAEDDYYSSLQPPYRAANRPFQSLTELRLVRGMTAELYDKLAKFMTALPGEARLNVNTASAEVLAAAIDGLDLSGAEELVLARELEPFADVDSFMSQDAIKGLPVDRNNLSVNSHYFRAVAEVLVNDNLVRISTYLYRPNPRLVKVLYRLREQL